MGWEKLRDVHRRITGAREGEPRRVRGERVSLPFAAQGFVVLVCVALLGLVADHAWQDRNARLREAESASANLARALVQQAEDAFGVADAILVSLAERFEREGAAPEALAGVERQMAAQVAASPRVSALFLYGEDGDRLATSVPSSAPGLNNADRAYFRHHRAEPDRGPHLGQPVVSRSRDTWIVTLSRRLQHADGSFAGVVMAAIDADHFSDQYRAFDIGPKGTITLFRTEGVLLSRYPFDQAQMGRSFAEQSFFRDRLPHGPSGSYRFVSPIDGVEKVAGYHSGRSFPVLVLAASAVEDVLRGWAADTAGRLASVGPAIGLLAWLGTRLSRQVRRRQRAERALGESELHFRLLTEMSGDMVTRVGLDGVRHYVSPASTSLLGWTPAELLGTRALSAVHPDDLQAARDELTALAAGAPREGTIAYRTWRRDGREIWIESNVRVTKDATGAPDGAVVISRDITARKVLEEQLATLATTDGLTGLANRRRLDEALLSEWRRAARDGTVLSLALMDVDRFKLFNDRYGHGAGDDCLRAVASVLAHLVQRPADLPARYGGEELAALLPGTGAGGAGEVAESLRAAIEALGIAHEDSPPAGVVTASIGVATVAPMPRDDPAAGVRLLMRKADEALYEAKKAGRNRVVLAAEDPHPGVPGAGGERGGAGWVEHLLSGA